MSTVTSQTPKVVAETVVTGKRRRLPVDLPPSAPAFKLAAGPGASSCMLSAPGRGPLKHKNPAKFEIDINKSFVMPNRCRQIQTLF